MPRRTIARPKPDLRFDRGNYVPGIGLSGAKIAIVGEAPGADEEREGIPFVGNAGKKLDKILIDAGMSREEVYITNVCKYRPPMNDFKRIDEMGLDLNVCINDLFKELRDLDPNIVIALGDNALFALTGKRKITKVRGSIFPALYGDFKVLGTIHPAHLLRLESPWLNEESVTKSQVVVNSEIVTVDFIKAKKESLSKKFNHPPRNIQLITDSLKLYKWLNSYSDKEPCIDIECHKCIPIMLGIGFTPWDIAVVPLMPLYGFDGELRLQPHEYAALYKVLADWFARPDLKFIGQNIKFDLDKLMAVSKLIHPFRRNLIAADTELMMGVAYPELPKNLGFINSVFTNEPFYKDEGKEFNPKKDRYQVFVNYNGKDVGVTKESKLALDKELESCKRADHIPAAARNRDTLTLKDFYYDYINKLPEFFMDMEAEGLIVDEDRRQELLKEYREEIDRIHKSNVDILGTDYNPKSYTKDVPRIITEILKLPARAGYGEDELVALLGNHTDEGSPQAKVLRQLLEERQALTNIGYLEAAYDADGRMRTSWHICSTKTGRSSTSNLRPPLRPFKGKPKQMGLSFNTLPKHGPFAKRIRSIFVAGEGYQFYERDYSQAEARIVCVLADDLETLKLFDTVDIHRLTASWNFGGDPKDITEDQRFVGKTTRHAGNYGQGKRQHMLHTNSDAIKFGFNVKLSEKDSQRVQDIFHKKTPNIRGVFQREVRDIVQKTRILWNPYGRMRQFFGYLKDTEAYAQIPQSTVPDLLRKAGLKMKEAYPQLRFLMDMHDAFVWRIREEKVEWIDKITKEFMEVEIDFKYCSLPRGKLIIPTEAKVGYRLSDLKKV